MTDGISVADALALGRANDEGFGGNGAWWIVILVLLFAGGWGRGGYGDGGYGACCTPATAQGMTDAFNFNQLDNGIRGVQNGLCDGFYAQTNALKDCCCENRLGLANGVATINSGLATLGFQNQQGFCDIAHAQENLRYDLAAQTNAIIQAGDKNTDRIINYLTQSEIDSLRTELQSAQYQLSQAAQTNNIINQLMPVAKPAYITCSPYAAAFGVYNGNGCGCA